MVSKAVLESEIEKKFKQIFKVNFKPQRIFGKWVYRTTELIMILDKLDKLEELNLLFKQQEQEDDEEYKREDINELNTLGQLKPY